MPDDRNNKKLINIGVICGNTHKGSRCLDISLESYPFEIPLDVRLESYPFENGISMNGP